VRQLGRLGSDSKAKAVAQRVVKEVQEKKAKGEKVKLGAVVRKHVDKALASSVGQRNRKSCRTSRRSSASGSAKSRASPT
jgi:hypothetical protein